MERSRYNAEYSKRMYKHLHIKVPLYMNSVVKKLEDVPNVNQYIIGLIRADLGIADQDPDERKKES